MLILTAALAAGAAPVAQDAPEGDCGDCGPDNDPAIYPGEVIAPSIDSRDPAWMPGYKWFEEPESVECGDRDACEAAKANATRAA